ncbi:MFS transporter [Aspergillus violaceofuscus CBS 115571]|uniref:MFS transporter n=1 Tax=Aspergillus violaceofuscus (strain CBS 115571) TaxID=1450538 RepID=A0A2V5HEP6_ASPV1|nr:MFS transporter [Aspergillus violaceofuscus CBS 115571]
MRPQADQEMIDLSQQQPEPAEPPEPSIADTRWLDVKILSAGFSFFVAGVNDGSLGSLIPYVIRSYHVSTNLVVVVYVSTFAGWLVAAVTNSALCQYLGLGAILALVVTFFLASLGQAYNDTHANTYVASVKAAHRWLGFIHAMYMAGCLVGPLVATAVASAGTTTQWNLFYLAPLGLGVLNLVFVMTAFHDQLTTRSATFDPSPERPQEDAHPDSKSHRALVEIKNTLCVPTVWLASLYFFFFLGAAITAGGWMVEYLVNVRHGNLDAMGYVPTGFYGGAFLGRLLLAEPTFRLGERRMIFLYAAVAICILGFFSGPFFAAGISVASKIFPADVRSSAIAFVFVFGQIGGSLFPVLTGILSARTGVKVLQPMLVALLCATAISWLLLPKPPKPRD